jgi:holo-[acyl-carrier protein] synthase
MIFSVGVDTVEPDRIKKTITVYGDRFIGRIFHPDEIAYCKSSARSSEHFAARFAAKEAFSKALGTGIRGGFRWREVVIRRHSSGKPYLVLEGSMVDLAQRIVGKNFHLHLSLSHSKSNAEAIVVIETLPD